MGKWHIYHLMDPRTGEIRYVGKTIETELAVRVIKHVHASANREKNTHKSRWIQKLIREGVRPALTVIETGSGDGWVAAEQDWIALYEMTGARLTNLTDGGEGRPGYKHTPETLAKMSASHMGQRHSPEAVEKTAAFNRGKARTAEVRAKISASKMGHPVSAEAIAKQKATLKATLLAKKLAKSSPGSS